MKLALNLARRPFVNDRPLVVVTAVVAVLGLLASFGNVYLLFEALAESRRLSARLVAEQEETKQARSEAKALAGRFEDKEKRRIRLVAGTAARIIQKRQLSWSRLFDELELVLPRDVRILQINPEPQGKRMSLVMEAVAKTNEAKLKFYRKLHEPPFSDAYIIGESLDEGKTRFQIRCRYDPQGAEAEPIWEPMPWEPKEPPSRGRPQAADAAQARVTEAAAFRPPAPLAAASAAPAQAVAAPSVPVAATPPPGGPAATPSPGTSPMSVPVTVPAIGPSGSIPPAAFTPAVEPVYPGAGRGTAPATRRGAGPGRRRE